MSNIVLFIVLLTCIFTETSAQVVCVDPIHIGELRVLQTKTCVDIDGFDGSGNVQTHDCDGYRDQLLILCKDGTIRNSVTPHNCITPDEDGRGNLVSTTCEVYPVIPDYQKWRFGRSKSFLDAGGIQQVAREIINVKSGECMDVEYYEGSGNIDVYPCENLDDQYFYPRSRGKLMDHGRLQNEKSGLCLDVSSYDGRGNVQIFNCEEELDQYFYFYENGELVNKRSGLCVDIAGYSGSGDIAMHPCEDLQDQMWTQPHQYCHGDYCSFRSEKSGKCMDVSGYDAEVDANVGTYKCEGAPDQRFRWVTDKWVTPTATWTMIGCNQNGHVSHTISNTISYKTKITAAMAVEISATIEAGFVFGSTSVSTSVSTSLAREWEDSQSKTKAITFTCEIYDTGKPFVRGCMWQLQLTTKEKTKDDMLKWSPQIVKCSSNHVAPKCPPFTKCKDDACTMCEEIQDIKKKRSVGSSLTWKKVLKMN